MEFDAIFRIVGRNVDPEKITSLLRIPPDRFHKRGDPLPKAPEHSRPYGGWFIESGNSKNESPAVHLESLTTKLDGKKKEIQEIRNESDTTIEFYCGCFLEDESESKLRPIIEFSSELMSKTGDLGINLNIHLYDDSESDE